ncbi:MAG: hypothetical protein ABJG78_12460 [Cyclobacteriaceae bacterium]
MIQTGSKVVNKTDVKVNDSLMMEVVEIENGKALCSLHSGAEEWYKVEDLREVYPPRI